MIQFQFGVGVVQGSADRVDGLPLQVGYRITVVVLSVTLTWFALFNKSEREKAADFLRGRFGGAPAEG